MGIMSLREVMDGAVDILRKYIKTTLLFTFGYGAIGMFATVILILIASIGGVITFAVSKNSVVLAIIISLAILLVIAIFLSINVGMIKIANQEFLGEQVLAHNAIGDSFKSILKVTGIVLCGIIIFIPVIAIFAGITYAIFKGFENSLIVIDIFRAKEIFLIILSIIVMVAAVMVVVAYTTLIGFSFHAMAIENKGVIGSIIRSFKLVKINFWKMFGCTILISFTIYAITSSIQGFFGVVGGIIFLILKALNVQQDFMAFITMVTSIVNWPLTLISWVIITPISMNMISLLYFNQRIKHEGYDLVLKLRELKKNEERKQAGELV
jgi:hypothetical protein